jgi:hypothetical protein
LGVTLKSKAQLSTESDVLVVVDQFFREGSAFVNAIISMVRVHSYSHFMTVPFKFVLGVNGGSGIHGDLGTTKMRPEAASTKMLAPLNLSLLDLHPVVWNNRPDWNEMI